MPQKMNPDAAELLRAKAPRVLASYTTLPASCTACRSPTPRTCRRTRSRSSTPSTRSSSASSARRDACRDRLRSRADGGGGRRRDGRRDRHRRPAGPPRDAVPRGPRGRRRPGTRTRSTRDRALRHRRDELGEFSELLDDEYYEVLAEGAWLDSKLSARGDVGPRRSPRQLELAPRAAATGAR